MSFEKMLSRFFVSVLHSAVLLFPIVLWYDEPKFLSYPMLILSYVILFFGIDNIFGKIFTGEMRRRRRENE